MDTCVVCGGYVVEGRQVCKECMSATDISNVSEKETLLDLIRKYEEIEAKLVRLGYIGLTRPESYHFNSQRFLELAQRHAKTVEHSNGTKNYPHQLSFCLGGHNIFAIYSEDEFQEALEAHKWLESKIVLTVA
jgi:hypothetical protein